MLPPESETVTFPPLPGALALPTSCQVTWRQSARARRISLRICPNDAAVIISLPMRASRRAGLALLRQHQHWVMVRLAAIKPAAPLAADETIMLGGIPHRIRHQSGARGGAFLDGTDIVVAGDPAFLRRRVLDFLRAEARRRIALLAPPHAAALGVKLGPIRLKDTRSRWGSCAANGTLAFSWRLVMAPDWVLDYVVAHEVAHLREMNHSVRFWRLVESRTPHRAAAVAWLRAEGPALLRVA